MSKGNLFLGQARGKVGSVVFTRSAGEQISRSYNPSPKQTPSDARTIQQASLASVAKAYKALEKICDHSFEGVPYGRKSRQRFMKLNLDYFAKAVAQNDKDLCFQLPKSVNMPGNKLVVSEGSLEPINPIWINGKNEEISYEDALKDDEAELVVKMYGLQKGDTLRSILRKYHLDKPKSQQTEVWIHNYYKEDVPVVEKLKTNPDTKIEFSRTIRNEKVADDSVVYDGSNMEQVLKGAKDLFTEISERMQWVKDEYLPDEDGTFFYGVPLNSGAWGIIRSEWDPNKGWLRSSCQLYQMHDYPFYENSFYGVALPNLLDVWPTTDKSSASAKYLNNGTNNSLKL